MKKITYLFTLLLALFFCQSAWADEVTTYFVRGTGGGGSAENFEAYKTTNLGTRNSSSHPYTLTTGPLPGFEGAVLSAYDINKLTNWSDWDSKNTVAIKVQNSNTDEDITIRVPTGYKIKGYSFSSKAVGGTFTIKANGTNYSVSNSQTANVSVTGLNSTSVTFAVNGPNNQWLCLADFAVTVEVPFEVSADPTSSSCKKYFMTLKGKYCGGGTGDNLGKDLVSSYDVTNPNFVWSFGGSLPNGVTIYNKGLAKYAKFSNTDNCVVSYVDSEDKSTFDISVYQNYFGFKVHGSTNIYLNSRNSKFSTWNNNNGTPNDEGSRFTFTPVYTVTFSEAVAVNGGSAVSTIYVPNGNTISLPIDKSYAINGGEAMTSLEAAEAIHSISGDMTITVDDQTELVWKGASFVSGGTANFFGFGIVLPDGAEDGHAYSFDKFEFYKVNKDSKYSTQSYVAITKTAPSYSYDKVSATDVIAVSNNAPEYSEYSYCQYDFDNPVILKKGVTYYVQFFISNVPVNGYYTGTFQRMGINHQTGSNSYPPGMYGADGTTYTNYTPDFRCIVEDEGTANDVTVTVNYKFGEATTSTETVNAIGGQKYEANYLKKSQWLDPADDSNLFTVINDGTTTQTVNVDLAANKSTYRLYSKRGYTGGTQSEIGSFSDSGTHVGDGTHPGALTVYNGQLTNTFMDVNYENNSTKTLTPGEFALVYYNSTFYLYDVSSGKYLSRNSSNNKLYTIDKYSVPNGSLTMGSSGQSTFIFKPTWTTSGSDNGYTINCTRWSNLGAVVNEAGNDAGCYYKVEKVQDGTFDATEALKAFSNKYSLYETYIKPFIDNTDDDKLFFLSETNKASVLSQASEIEDKYCSEEEYVLMKAFLNNLVNKPTNTLVRIKNNATNNYIAYGTAVADGSNKPAGLIAKADADFTDGTTVFNLTQKTPVDSNDPLLYKIYNPSQSKYVGSQTAANTPFPLEDVEEASAQVFRFGLTNTPGVVVIYNSNSVGENENIEGYLLETSDGGWTVHGVVNWESAANESKWIVEKNFSINMLDVTACSSSDDVYMGWGNNTGFDVTFTDEDTKVYTAKSSNGTDVLLTDSEFSSGKTVPAGEAVILKNKDAAKLNITLTTASGEKLNNNLLKKGTGEGVVSEGSYSRYILAYASAATEPLFYYLNQSYAVPVNKAYLEINSGDGSRSLSIRFGDDDVETGLEKVESAVGNLPIYDLQGRRVEKAQKGLYIVGGRKVLVK